MDTSHPAETDDDLPLSEVLVSETDVDEEEEHPVRVKRQRLSYNKPPLQKNTIEERVEYLQNKIDKFQPIKLRKFYIMGDLLVDIRHMKMYEEMKKAEEKILEAVKTAMDNVAEAVENKIKKIKRMLRCGMFASKGEAINYIEDSYHQLVLHLARQRRKVIEEPKFDTLVDLISNDEILRTKEQVIEAVRANVRGST